MVKVLFTLFASAAVAAQIPLREDPHHKVMFENAAFRVLDVNIPPGTTSADHRHDLDIATISIAPGTTTRVQRTGQPWDPPRAARALGDAAVTEYTGKPGSHRVENTGASAYRLFAVENLKKGGWSATPAATGLGTKMTAESRAFRIYDVRLNKGAAQVSHTHAVPTIAVLIAGTVLSDGPDARAKEHAPASVGLKQLSAPGEWLLVPAGDTHHLVRLQTADAHVVEIEVR